ncbi:sucrase ferredoxin [Actinacidiphila sp. bgisy145]|uniref:sucrase ferredoxin n=1 Tax=Actinacidiphila sp. bgisy145 TaxID=3413792 RepID=UPI003EB704E1
MSLCTSASIELAEPTAATAATARTWLLIEQPGPWGAKALRASHLDPALGRELERLADGTGVRLGLIRRPGRHADTRRPRHRVVAAHTAPGRSWVRSTEVADPADLAALDFQALGAGLPAGFGAPADGPGHPPIALVCTNGTRDRCCAVQGRPLAAELAADSSLDVWETTHLGGHRFAPTMLVLPHGYAYGRLDAATAKAALTAAHSGRIALEGCRGRSSWSRPGQAADLAVRALIGEDGADALAVHSADPVPAVRPDNPGNPAAESAAWSVHVRHTDGREWRALVAQHAATPPRPESCGAALGTPARMDVESIEQTAPGTPAP